MLSMDCVSLSFVNNEVYLSELAKILGIISTFAERFQLW